MSEYDLATCNRCFGVGYVLSGDSDSDLNKKKCNHCNGSGSAAYYNDDDIV